MLHFSLSHTNISNVYWKLFCNVCGFDDGIKPILHRWFSKTTTIESTKVRGENDDDLTREASLSGRNATGIDPEEVLIWFGNVPVDSERVAIAILFTGILFLLTIVLHSWRQDLKKRRRQRRLRNAERDLPPSYNQVVDRKSPPEYKESLMQVWRGLFLKARYRPLHSALTTCITHAPYWFWVIMLKFGLWYPELNNI